MPMFKALELCPEAVVVPPNMEKYVGVGREVRALMQALTPQVEPLSIDEAFLDLAGTEKLHGMPPALVLARFAQTVERSSASPFRPVSPTASSWPRSPRTSASRVVFRPSGEAEAPSFLAEHPVTLIWGVGKALAATLERDGIRMIAQLQRMERGELMRRYA